MNSYIIAINDNLEVVLGLIRSKVFTAQGHFTGEATKHTNSVVKICHRISSRCDCRRRVSQGFMRCHRRHEAYVRL